MGYKRNELKLYSHGYADLAQAVLTQWAVDGRPKGDSEGISIWSELYQAHLKQMYQRHTEHGLLGITRKR